MSLINALNLAKSYGVTDIFSGITLTIPRQARIAIVGPNGIGKTTLIRILLGLEEPSAGSIQQARGLRIGYLPQEAMLSGDKTLWEECLDAIHPLLEQEAELARLEGAMSDSGNTVEILERYGELQQAFELQGGYTYQTRIRQILTGLGFDPSDDQRPIQQLSGGQRTRAYLARLLLYNPDLLILDEPTNHLDISAVEWLEGYLSQWGGAALIVSHDRYFLDKVVDHIWEMSRTGMEVYPGNYSAYVQERQIRWEWRQQVFEAEKERLTKEVEYIRRNISGQNTLQAKGRLRRLSRYLDAVERSGLQAVQGKKWSVISEETGATSQVMSVEEVTQRVRGLRNPEFRPPSLRLNLKSRLRSGDLVVRTHDLEIGYADEGQPLFQAPDLIFKRGECAALIGPNGAGKTTFLKTLLDLMPAYSGEVILGASLEIAYFAQAHEDLRLERTLMEEIESVAPKMLPAEIRHYLGKFLFSGDEVFKKVDVLSGGERGRLALAKLSLSNANLLLLDEPTNHLDIPSQEILQDVLANYQGTIILVSHDRYLIDALGTQIWEIDPEQADSNISTKDKSPRGTSLRVFSGSYTEYRAVLEAERALTQERKEIQNQQKTDLKAAQPRRKSSTVAERRRVARLQEVENQIAGLETQLHEISLQLEKPPTDAGLVQKLGQNYVDLQEQVAELLSEWETLQQPVEIEA